MEGYVKKLFPRVRKLKFAQGYVMSFRWFSRFVDILFSKEGYHFVQYGAVGKPTKFVCRILKSAKKPPMFLYSDRWSIYYKSKNLLAGEGKKPFDLSKMWKGARNGVC